MLIMKTRLIIIAAVLSSTLIVSSCQPAQTEVTDGATENESVIESLTELVTELEEQRAQLADENRSLLNLVTEKEEQNAELAAENRSLSVLLTELETELQSLLEPQAISHAPHDGWEAYFPEFDQSTLIGETTDMIKERIGNPPYMIRSIAINPEFSREIWVYTPYQDDPTGLYLFFQNSVLTNSRLDEFQGLYGSGLLDYDDFWR